VRSSGSSKSRRAQVSSQWRMRIYSSSRGLRRMPDLRFLDKIGSASVKRIDFKTGADFRKVVPHMPKANYAWAFYGNVDIISTGVYRFCSTSDDGSLVYVDNAKVVNNDGLHGPRERCGDITLSAGRHSVMTDGFQHYGGAYMKLTYAGKDTGGLSVKRFVRSSSAKAPKLPKTSKWTMRMYRAKFNLYHMPDFAFLDLVGENKVRSIDFRGLNQMREVAPNTPNSNYAWAFYGRVKIHQEGQYYWCTTSDDGSFLYVDGKMVVNNDGLHGDRERCGLKVMSRGMHDVEATGFQHGGGVTMIAKYSGPDTGGHKVFIPSDDDTKAPKPVPQSAWGMKIYRIQSTNHVPNILKNGRLVGSAVVPIVDFHGLGSIRRYVPATPHSWYAWIFWGKVEIKTGGTYTFCSTSDDGSHVYVNGRHIVNNDGLHGARERCGTIQLNKGGAKVRGDGFQAGGGVDMVLKYSGPDTRYHKVFIPSIDSSQHK